MAKLTSPLMSQTASGTIGPRMTFSMRKSGAQVRIQKFQKDKFSLSQLTHRSIYNFALAKWNSFTISQKSVYQLEAKKLKMSGYNFFMKQALSDTKTYLSLVGFWSFNEFKGDIVYDYSKNHYNGTLLPNYPSDIPTRINSLNKKRGKMLSFNGTSNYISLGSNTPDLYPKTSDFTLNMWLKLSASTGVLRSVWTGTANGGSYGFGVQFVTTRQRLSVEVRGSIGGRQQGIYSFTPYLNQLCFCSFVIIQSTFKVLLYINGKLITTFQFVPWGSINQNSTSILTIGSYILPFWFYNGLMDNISVFRRALSATEIHYIYNSENRN